MSQESNIQSEKSKGADSPTNHSTGSLNDQDKENTAVQQPDEAGEDSPDPRQRKLQGFSWAIVVITLVSSTFLYALDNTILANIRPSIIESLGELHLLPWLSVAYAMTEASSSLMWGRLHSLFDLKILYVVALAIFEVGSAISGAAPSMKVLILGRAIGGLGGSGIYVGCVSILSAMTSLKERPQYQGYLGMAWALGTVVGPLLGAAFADSDATWRWSFYINLCVAAISGPVAIWIIPSLALDTWPSLYQRARNLDIVGILLYFGALMCVIMILAFGGSIYDWEDGRMIALYATSGFLWVIFVIQQYFNLFCVKRIFPAQYLKSPEMINLGAMVGIAIANVVIAIYILPLFFQFAFGDSSIKSAVNTLPYIASAVVGAGLSGQLLPKFPRYMPWFLACGIFMLVGSALESTIDFGTSRSKVFGYTVIQGFGAGMVAQLPYTVAQAKHSPAEAADINIFLVCGQTAGLAIALGTATCVFVNEAANDISDLLPSISRDAVVASVGGAGSSIMEGLNGAMQEKILEIIGRTTGRVFYVNVAGAALALILSVFLKRDRLSLTA